VVFFAAHRLAQEPVRLLLLSPSCSDDDETDVRLGYMVGKTLGGEDLRVNSSLGSPTGAEASPERSFASRRPEIARFDESPTANPDAFKRDVFSRFVELVEPRLLRALIASAGPDAGRDATADALLNAWDPFVMPWLTSDSFPAARLADMM
jgi:hypothetical protein